jgi:hypothetical protein
VRKENWDYRGPVNRSGYRNATHSINIQRAQPAATKAAVELSELVKPEPLQRHLFREKEQGRGGKSTKWTCGCGRRHLIPNVDRVDFACPNCEDVFHG